MHCFLGVFSIPNKNIKKSLIFTSDPNPNVTEWKPWNFDGLRYKQGCCSNAAACKKVYGVPIFLQGIVKTSCLQLCKACKLVVFRFLVQNISQRSECYVLFGLGSWGFRKKSETNWRKIAAMFQDHSLKERKTFYPITFETISFHYLDGFSCYT